MHNFAIYFLLAVGSVIVLLCISLLVHRFIVYRRVTTCTSNLNNILDKNNATGGNTFYHVDYILYVVSHLREWTNGSFFKYKMIFESFKKMRKNSRGILDSTKMTNVWICMRRE
jgi:hypothetical protein